MAAARSSIGLARLVLTRKLKPPVKASVSCSTTSFTLKTVAMKMTLKTTTAKLPTVMPVRKRLESG